MPLMIFNDFFAAMYAVLIFDAFEWAGQHPKTAPYCGDLDLI